VRSYGFTSRAPKRGALPDAEWQGKYLGFSQGARTDRIVAEAHLDAAKAGGELGLLSGMNASPLNKTRATTLRQSALNTRWLPSGWK